MSRNPEINVGSYAGVGLYLDSFHRFTAEWKGEEIRNETWEGLTAVIDRAIEKERKNEKVKIEIPVTVIKNGKACDAIITGLHGASGYPMVKLLPPEKGSFQHSGYRREVEVMKRLTADQANEWLQAVAARVAADKRERSLRNEWEMTSSEARRTTERAISEAEST